MKPILVWQYNSLIKELLLLQQHSQDPSCPCESEGEMCARKHLLTIEALAEETATIEVVEKMAALLNKLALEAKEHRAKEEQKLCGAEIEPADLAGWTRNWRKEFEELSLACDLAPVDEALVKEVTRMFLSQPFYPEFKPETTLVHVGPGLKGIIPQELSFTKVQTKLIRSKSYDPAKAPVMKQASDLQPYFRLMRNADQEWLLAIYADRAGHVVGADEISIGERFGTVLALDTVYRSAILLNASKIFLAHNHPSGSSEPSEEDIKAFENMRDFCPLLNIAVEDFIVVGANEDFSIRGNLKLPAPPTKLEEVARMFKEEPRWCFGVRSVNKELGGLARNLGIAKDKALKLKKKLELPINICRGQAEMFESTTGVLDPYGSRCRDPETGQWVYSEECGFEPAGITTTALGMDGLTQYEFEFRLVSADKLIVSHDPFTFTPNPQYPKELQPRLRERAATKIQVEKIAANLEPDAVIVDFHVIDRGTPIIGSDMVVEAGNGRIMGIVRAAADYPDKYADYKARLRERARDYGLSPKDVDLIENPILVRVRLTEVDRTTFTQEANQAATIAPSAIENARTDAQKITLSMLQELVVGEDESLEDALRAPKNQVFAKRFLSTLPETVQAALVDAQGYLNRDGVHRMAMAVFVSAFQGDSGLRLAEKAFESLSMDVRNSVSAIARSLGPLAQAESLIRAGERDTSLSIGDDLAQTVNVYSAIKRNPALTVEKYLAQEQMFARELTPFQEGILIVLDEHRRSPKKLASIFTAYAEGVIEAPPPAQAALFPGAEITKEGLWESALKIGEAQPALMEVARMFSGEGKSITRKTKAWLDRWVWTTKAELPTWDIVDELSQHRPKRSVKLYRGITGEGLKTDYLKKLKSYTYEKAMAEFIAEDSGGKVETRTVYPSEILVDFTKLPMYEKEYINEVIVMSPDFVSAYKKAKLGDNAELSMPAPFGWVGGKRQLSKKIVSLIPPHKTYVEPFCGAASVFWAKEPSQVEVLNDLDPDLMRFYRDIGGVARCNLAQISKDWDKLKAKDGKLGACEFLSEVLCSYGNLRAVPDVKGSSKKVCDINAPTFHNHLPQYQARLKDTNLQNEDWRKVTLKYDFPDTFFYFDPPYHFTSRRYKYSDDQLAGLADTLPKLKGKWLLSYDDHSDIWEAFKDYHILPVTSRYTIGAKFNNNKTKGKQLLIANYPIEGKLSEEDEVIEAIKEASLEQSALSAIGSAAITGVGIGAGFKFIDWLARKFSKKELKEGEMGEKDYKKFTIDQKWTAIVSEATDFVMMLTRKYDLRLPNIVWMVHRSLRVFKAEKPEGLYLSDTPPDQAKMGAEAPYARQIPAYVDVFKTTIDKHYRPTEDFHDGSIRVLKPEKDILVYLGCLKADDWDGERCSPNPTVVKTIVPNTKKYRDELDHLKLVHPEVKVNYREKEVGVEPVVAEDEKELQAVGKALDNAEEVA